MGRETQPKEELQTTIGMAYPALENPDKNSYACVVTQ
jgi:hypothetical protein